MSKKITSYKDLVVWQKSVELARCVYVVTRQLPKEERYGLASQMQRSSVSIGSNIAEGYGRNSRKDYCQFLRIARGSTYELDTQLTICKAVYPTVRYNEVADLSDEVSKMLNSLIRRVSTHT